MDKPKMIPHDAAKALAALAASGLPRQHTRRNGTAIGMLHSRGTLPNGKTFWRTERQTKDLNAWIARSAKGNANVPLKDAEIAIRAIQKRERKAAKLKLIRAAGGIR